MRLARALAVAAVMAAAACGAPAASEEGVLPEAGRPAGVVVDLEFDAANDRLIRAYAHAVEVADGGGAGWNPIPLPAATAANAIDDIAVSASGDVFYIAVAGTGAFSSRDRGRTWKRVGADFPARNVVALATHAVEEETLYAFTEGDDAGVFRSEDAAQAWTRMDGGPGVPVGRFVHSPMEGSMQTGWLFAATPTGVIRSMDCFCGWRAAGEVNGAVHEVAYDPREPKRVYAATASGLYRSEDGGESWEDLPGVAGVSFVTVTPDGVLYAAGPDRALARSGNGGRTWEVAGD